VGTAGGFIFALPGGWLGDRFGRHVVLISSGFVTAAFPLVNAFVPSYSWVLVCGALGGAVNGLAAGSNAALQADCLPVHPETGQPVAAARDMLMIGVGVSVMSALVPTVLGHAFVLFPDKRVGYQAFFCAAAAIHAFSVCLLMLVDPVGAKAAARLEHEKGQLVLQSDGDYRREYRRAHVSGLGESEPLVGLHRPSRAQAYTQRLASRRAQDYRSGGSA